MLKITKCPTWGSDKIKQVRRNWSGKYLGRPSRSAGNSLDKPARQRTISGELAPETQRHFTVEIRLSPYLPFGQKSR